MVAADVLAAMKELCPDAAGFQEAGREYIFLPGLKLPPGRQPATTDGLLCLSEHEGYATRLFLATRHAEVGGNWKEFRILDRTWHTWSWNHIPNNQHPLQVLAEHLRGLR